MKFLRVIFSLLRFDRTNWTALALCLFAAAVFWVFNALNKDYDTQLLLPLRVEFDEERFASAEAIPAMLPVNIHGNGWELLRNSLGYKVPFVSVPLDRPAGSHRIPGSALAPNVISQLGDLKLNFVVLDTLRLKIEPRVTRKIKLVADISRVSYRSNLGRTGPVTIEPDSVILDGPQNYLEALPDTLSIVLPARRITAQYRETLEIELANGEFIRRNPPVAEVIFNVGTMVERSYRLPVTGQPGLSIEPDTVALAIRIPAQIPGGSPDSLRLTLEIPAVTLERGQVTRVVPRVAGIPPYATVLSLDSIDVKRRLP